MNQMLLGSDSVFCFDIPSTSIGAYNSLTIDNNTTQQPNSTSPSTVSLKSSQHHHHNNININSNHSSAKSTNIDQNHKKKKITKLNPMDALLKTVKTQLQNNKVLTRDDYNIVSLFQNVRQNDAEHLFGDVHLEINLGFINNNDCWTMEGKEEKRFMKFQYWRPCYRSEVFQNELLVRFSIQPNIHSRTSDYSRFIEAYRNAGSPLLTKWSDNIATFQTLTQQMKTQMKRFFDQISQDPNADKCFRNLQQQFRDQTQEQISILSKKYSYFAYYFGATNETTYDFEILNFGISQQLMEVLSTNIQDSAQALMKYGLPFFMTQRTRLQRYMSDLEFLVNGTRQHETQEFITLDEFSIPASMTPEIYEMKFTPEQLSSLPADMIMFLRIAMHFRVDIYEFDKNMLTQLKTLRETNKLPCKTLSQQYLCADLIFGNELIDKYYSKEPGSSTSSITLKTDMSNRIIEENNNNVLNSQQQ